MSDKLEHLRADHRKPSATGIYTYSEGCQRTTTCLVQGVAAVSVVGTGAEAIGLGPLLMKVEIGMDPRCLARKVPRAPQRREAPSCTTLLDRRKQSFVVTKKKKLERWTPFALRPVVSECVGDAHFASFRNVSWALCDNPTVVWLTQPRCLEWPDKTDGDIGSFKALCVESARQQWPDETKMEEPGAEGEK